MNEKAQKIPNLHETKLKYENIFKKLASEFHDETGLFLDSANYSYILFTQGRRKAEGAEVRIEVSI